MTASPINRDRADWAKLALTAFTAETYCGDHPDAMHPGDLECAIGDLIADLLHFAAQQGFDPGELLGRAHEHFQAEAAEEARP
ncbi:MAG: hypothetical protein AB7G17_01065 [Phycisphaerales bacterium]